MTHALAADAAEGRGPRRISTDCGVYDISHQLIACGSAAFNIQGNRTERSALIPTTTRKIRLVSRYPLVPEEAADKSARVSLTLKMSPILKWVVLDSLGERLDFLDFASLWRSSREVLG